MRNRVVILMLGILLFSGGLAQAELITIAISGYVTSIDDPHNHFGGQIVAGTSTTGTPITGTYAYNSMTQDSNPSTTLGDYEYNAPPVGIWLTAGNFDFATDSSHVSFHIGVYKDTLEIEDQLVIGSRNNMLLPDGTLVQHIGWQLGDLTATALSSDALPLTAPDLSKWSYNSLWIANDRDFSITATITSATPEPATLFLLGLGAMLARKRFSK
jgi:hypothetical protein